MDFHGNSVHHIGYGHPRLIAAIKDQLDQLPFSPRRFTNAVSVALAERLEKITPGNLGKTLFTTGGSDANEVALRLARAATGRFKTLSLRSFRTGKLWSGLRQNGRLRLATRGRCCCSHR